METEEELEAKTKARRLSKQAKKEEELDQDILPDTGLYNTDGHLFYHASCNQLTATQYNRAKEHGINLRSMKNFTLEETIHIFKNWNQYATENNVRIDKAHDYIMAKKKEKHILQHQEDNKFWVKLCHGLPHRACIRVKRRAEFMMTDDFMKDLDWSNLPELIRLKFFQHEPYDEATMQKMQKLLEKGYRVPYAAEILDVNVSRGMCMSAKIRNLESRDDRVMINSVFESALYFGLDHEELRRRVIANDDDLDVDRLRKTIKIKEISVKLHISENRCQQLLKQILKMILKKYREISSEELTEDDAWDLTMREFSDKPLLEEHQLYKALEIFCQNVEREDTSSSLRKNRKLAEIIKSQGITGFHCIIPEFQHIHNRIYWFLAQLEKEFFDHLRRDFRIQVKLHCLLWSYKRLEVWEKLLVPADKTRYQVVLESEHSNPLVSKLTRKFLKNEKVVEWITDPRYQRSRKNAWIHKVEAAVEAFILFAHQKFSGNFKFPAKLAHLVSGTSSSTIQTILTEISDSENSEYLSIKQAKKAVEQASGNKILVKVKHKSIVPRQEDVDPDSDDVDDDPEDVERLLEHSRQIGPLKSEERLQAIENILEKADPEKIRKKFRMREEDVEELWLGEEILRQKRVMRRAAERHLKGKFCSAEFIETESESSDDDVRREEEEEPERIRTYSTESDDVRDSDDEQKDVKDTVRTSDDVRNSDDVKDSDDELEDVEATIRSSEEVDDSNDVRDSYHERGGVPVDSADLDDVEATVGISEDVKDSDDDVHRDSDGLDDVETDVRPSEDVKNSDDDVHMDSDAPDDVDTTVRTSGVFHVSEDVPEASEVVATEKKKKKKRKHVENSEDVVANSEDVNKSDDVAGTSEDVITDKKKSKKQKMKDAVDISEEVRNSDDVPEASEDVVTAKKKKKRKHRDLEDVEPPEGVATTSEDVTKKKKKHNKRKLEEAVEDSEDVLKDDVGNPEGTTKLLEKDFGAPESSEDVTSGKKKKKKKRKNQDLEELKSPEDVGISEAQFSEDVPEELEDVTSEKKRKKKRKHIEDVDHREDIPDEQKPKKKKRRRSDDLKDSEDPSEDVTTVKKKKNNFESLEDVEAPEDVPEDSEDVEKKKKKRKRKDSEAT